MVEPHDGCYLATQFCDGVCPGLLPTGTAGVLRAVPGVVPLVEHLALREAPVPVSYR